MEAKIVELPKLYFIGLKAQLTMKETDTICPALWSDLMSQSQDLDGNEELMCIAACLAPENCGENDTFTYMAGFASDKAIPPRPGFISHEISACTYAVFTHKGSVMNMGETYDYAYKTWLPNSKYQVKWHEDLEHYDSRFNPENSEKSEMDIYIPIQEKK